MRQQRRRQSAAGWIASGAQVTIKTFAHRYGLDRCTAYEDLTRPRLPPPARRAALARRPPADTEPPSTNWITLAGRASSSPATAVATHSGAWTRPAEG